MLALNSSTLCGEDITNGTKGVRRGLEGGLEEKRNRSGRDEIKGNLKDGTREASEVNGVGGRVKPAGVSDGKHTTHTHTHTYTHTHTHRCSRRSVVNVPACYTARRGLESRTGS